MTSRSGSFKSRGQGNARTATHRPAATNSQSAAAGRNFVEFHPSMSLENAPTLSDCLAVGSTSVPSRASLTCTELDAHDVVLEDILADRCQVWTKVNEVIEKLAPNEAYRIDIKALQKLQQLHLLCKQRETHLRALQLTLLQEGRATSTRRDEVNTNTHTPSKSEDEVNDDVSTINQSGWQHEQPRCQDFVDYDAMDLIELSEQFT